MPRLTFPAAAILLLLGLLVPGALSAPAASPPGRRTHYICGKTDPFCQFFEVCDVATRPNCPCLDRAGPGEPIFTHACPPFHSCEPFSPEDEWLYHVCKPYEGSPGGFRSEPGHHANSEEHHEEASS
ncbi:hypothetical protein BKA70DRAFT_1283126 [Coprinopsis sp. MPI-PUGE-AT-0042]|nr:hypothetical protein BKA70DRAFT_1283126 [Coprinopsis sp. MPI-PUGE-AT-0042]